MAKKKIHQLFLYANSLFDLKPLKAEDRLKQSVKSNWLMVNTSEGSKIKV